jgi:ferric-dicitrate binding protein FerR (iron transport regulator)
MNMANLKLERGEILVKAEQQSSDTTIYGGNFVKLKVKSGLFSVSNQPSDSSNRSVIKLSAHEGSAEVGFESGIAAGRALGAGQSLIIEISDAGKLVSMNQAEAGPVKIDPSESSLWFGRLITHKVVEAAEYLEKLKNFSR